MPPTVRGSAPIATTAACVLARAVRGIDRRRSPRRSGRRHPPSPTGTSRCRSTCPRRHWSPQGAPPSRSRVAATRSCCPVPLRPPTVEFGITASTKDHPGVDDVVGYHLNTLPMAFAVARRRALGDVVRSAAAQVAATIEHRTYPFADIVRDATSCRASSPPTSRACWRTNSSLPRVSRGTVEQRILASGAAVADVTFFVQERPDRVQLALEYCGAVLGRRDAALLLDMFAALIVDGSGSPERSVRELAAGVDAGADTVGAELDAPRRSALEQIVERAAAQPDALAVVDSSGRTLDYAQLVHAAVLLADEISAAAVGAPRRVGVAVGRSSDLVVAMLGAQLAGGGLRATRSRSACRAAERRGGGSRPGCAGGRTVTCRTSSRWRQPSTSAASRSAHRPPPRSPSDSDPVRTSSGDRPRHGCLRHLHVRLHRRATRRRGQPPEPRRQQRCPIGLLRRRTRPIPRHAQQRIRQLDGRARVAPDLGWHRRAARTTTRSRDVDQLGSLIERVGVTHVLMVPSLYRALLDRAARPTVAASTLPSSRERRAHGRSCGSTTMSWPASNSSTSTARPRPPSGSTAHRLSPEEPAC